MNRLSCQLFGVLLVGIFLAGCEKDPEQKTEPDTNQQGSADGSFVLNEGNFNRGNASLGYYKPVEQTYANKVFENTNGRPLGDVLHSIKIRGDLAYLVVNNSGKIEVIDQESFESTGTISDLPSPRFIRFVNDDKAYVTNFSQGNESVISIVNPENLNKTGNIPTGGWTEQMVMAEGKVFVTEVKAGHLLVLDPDVNAITDTISLSVETQSLKLDKTGNLWCLATGGIGGEADPVLYKINPASHEILKDFKFQDQNATPSNLVINGSKDTLYYLNDDVYRMSISDGGLPVNPYLKSGERQYYGLSVHPESGEVYLTDAYDYARTGTVYRYGGNTGNLVDSFAAGMIPKKVDFSKGR